MELKWSLQKHSFLAVQKHVSYAVRFMSSGATSCAIGILFIQFLPILIF